MDYGKSRVEFYEDEICRMSKQMAEMLDKGDSVELARSRSGLKLFSIARKHEIIRRVEK